MIYDLQKAGLWKRIAAWMFDGILTGILAVGFGVLLSMLLGYDAHSQALDDAYARYETEYGVVFDISAEEYECMTQAEIDHYNVAYDALIHDQNAMYAYNMVINLTMVITSIGILLAVLLWEFFIPLWIGNGQTLGKKIFSLCLVRNDGVKLNGLQLFARTVLGKYAVETMIPVFILMMLFWGTAGLSGTLVLFALALAQLLCIAFSRTNSAIHAFLADTVVVDIPSQMIFRTTEDLIAYKKSVHAEEAAKKSY